EEGAMPLQAGTKSSWIPGSSGRRDPYLSRSREKSALGSTSPSLSVNPPGVAAPPTCTVSLRCKALSREPDFPQAGSARLSIRQEDRRTRARRLVIDMDGLGGGRPRGRDPRLDYFVVRLSTPPSFVLWTGRRRKTVT